MTNENNEVIEAESYPMVSEGAHALALQTQQTPEVILARARKAAVALKDVVDHKAKPVKMNGETYLEFEDWQTLGNFYNMSAKVDSTTFVQFGEAQGFEAKASVIDKLTGRTITSAESMCLNDEEKWCSRAKYEWKNGAKVKTGEVPVPLFQLRSMAQTRACAKALRNTLAWVVVLAGYKPAVSEELDGMTDIDSGKNNAPMSKSPQRKSATEPTAEDLAAKAEAAKEQYKATEAPKSAPAKAQTPADGLKAMGIITNVGAPNGGGYVSIAVEGYQREDGKDKLFSTKNEKILDAISEHVAAGTHIEFTYTDNANPRFASSITELVA